MKITLEDITYSFKTVAFLLSGMTAMAFAWTDLIASPSFTSEATQINSGPPLVFFAHVVVAIFLSKFDIFNRPEANILSLSTFLTSFLLLLILEDKVAMITTAFFLTRMAYHCKQNHVFETFREIVQNEMEIAKI